mgnify:CR=1 FL=1
MNLSTYEIELIIAWLEDYYQMELYADTTQLLTVVNKFKKLKEGKGND